MKDRKPANSESEIQVNEHGGNEANSLAAPHGNIHWCHLIIVLTKHTHMLPAAQKPIIERKFRGEDSPFDFSFMGWGGLTNTSLEPFLLFSH